MRQPTPQTFLAGKSRPSPASVDITGYVSEATLPSMSQSPEEYEDPLDKPTFQRQNLFKRK